MSNTTDPRFVRARAEWDDRFADLARGKRNWQVVAGALLLGNLVMSIALGWLSTQSRITPFVVEVDKLGQAVAFGPAERLGKTEERLIVYQLSIYIFNLRTVLSDERAQQEILTRAYDYTRGPAMSFLNSHFSKQNPFEGAEANRVRVEVHSILPLAEGSWQVQWSETEMSSSGTVTESTHWQAILTLEIDPPESTEGILKNPLGLFVTEISWTKVL